MSWTESSIGDITSVVTKGTTPTMFTDYGVNYIKAGALNGDSSLSRSGFTFVSNETHEKLARSQLALDDVLVTIAGANVGKVGFVQEKDLPANTNQAVGIIRVDPAKANPRFVYYHFKNPITFAKSQGIGGGQAAQPNINLTVLKKFEISLPDKDQQKIIADFLSAYDDLIENNRRRIELLDESARQLYKEWFVRFRFPGHEHVKIVDGIPEGWADVLLGDALTLQRGFDLPVKSRIEGNVPIYASTGINGYHNQTKVKAPGIITGRSGSLGQVQFAHNDFWPLNTALWVKEFKLVDPYYAYFLLISLKLENYNSGAAVPSLNRNDAHKISVVVPTADFMSQFSEQMKSIFEQTKNLEDQNKNLAEARDLFLPKLMSGEVVV
jgi:type I restriction enzyme, S subunit